MTGELKERLSAPAWAGLMLLGMVGLLLPAVINGYPLIFPDSSDYIMLTLRIYRSPFYQFWVFVTGWKASPWPTIIAQAVLTSWLVVLFLRVEARASATSCALVLIVLTLFSSLPVVTTFVMPDLFTGVMFLSLFLLVLRWARLNSALRVILFVLVALAVSVHLSHLLMAAGIVVVSAALSFASDGRRFAKGAW